MKRNTPMLVGDIIKQAIDASGSRETFDRQRVCYIWPEVVGPTINRQTTRRWVDRDELHVCIASASLKNEMTFMTSAIVKQINDIMGHQVITKVIIH